MRAVSLLTVLVSYMFCRGLVIFIGLLGAVGVWAQTNESFPADWFLRAPTPEQIKAVQAAASVEGWGSVATKINAGVLKSYQDKREDSAVAWYYVARWSSLLGQSQLRTAKTWMETTSKAGLLTAAVPQRTLFALPNKPVADVITPETIAWLLSDRQFSESFFNLLSPCDYFTSALVTVQTLRDADVRRFDAYEQLAIAIALVYDSPPPEDWPHLQVTEKVLPRKLPEPLAAFNFFVDSDRRGATLQKLGTLSAFDLKFAVDLSAPFSDLEWAQRTVKDPITDLARTYESVRYQIDRITEQQFVWPGNRYGLEDILKSGGICVDQAYYATQAAKARGVPSLLFAGAGRDGRHAWFGYLSSGQKWVLDAGRYAEQQYVTGVSHDPQTWALLSDHELIFLTDGFRKLPPFRQSRQHQIIAELFLALGQKPAAAAAARKAVGYERRNVDAWNVLIAANADAEPKTREALLREAAAALQRYADLNAQFIRMLAASLRARGQASAAEFEERSIVRKNQDTRSDIGISHAAALVEAADETQVLRVYRKVLQQYAPTAAIDFFDRVTIPLVARLGGVGKKSDALLVLSQTRTALNPDENSQLDRELKKLTETVQ